MPVYFDKPSNYTVDGGTKSVVIKTLVYKQMHLNVMLVVLADGGKILPIAKQCPRSNCLEASLSHTNPKTG
jgi:hypothetical protein